MHHVPRILLVLSVAAVLGGCPRKTPDAPATTAPAAGGTATTPSASSDEAMPDMSTNESQGPQGKRAAGEEHAPLQAWRGFGTEPFWEARVEGDTLVFSTPEDPAGRTMKGRRVPSLVGYVFVGKDGDKDFNLGLTPGDCSDGMSDNRYGFTATFTYGAASYKGCGEAAK